MVHGKERTDALVGKVHRVLIEGTSKKRDDQFFGRTTHNTVVVFPKGNFKPGQYVNVKTFDSTAVTLIGGVTEEEAFS